MKRFYHYLLIILFVGAAGVMLFLLRKNEMKPRNERESISIYPQKDESKAFDKHALENQNSEKNSSDKLDKFAIEISRQICKEEHRAISALVDPSLEKLKPGDTVPLDAKDKHLSASQAIEWLRKTSTSKCSSFRHNNAEQFFRELKIDETNYKSIFFEFGRVLEEYQGFTPYSLIQKSLEALDKATEEEAKSLKQAILFSLITYVENASSHVDVIGAMLALKAVREKGLIAYQEDQLDSLKKEYEEIRNRLAREGQQLHQKYPASTADTTEKLVDIFGYEGIKEVLEHERKDYEALRRFAQKMKGLLVNDF